MTKRYTKEYLTPIIQSSKSFTELLRSLGLKTTGGGSSYIRKLVKQLNIDTSHFTGRDWAKGISRPSKRKIEVYLSNQMPIHSDNLKKRLIRENYFIHECHCCHNTSWLGKPIPLELHHKDKNHYNNNLENLTLLCPNCHASTHQKQ